MASNWCEAIATATQSFHVKSRFKLRNAIKAERWGNWLIVPAPDCLEIDASGPYCMLELEWIEIDAGEAGTELMIAVLSAAGI